jgi:hypothetical protein
VKSEERKIAGCAECMVGYFLITRVKNTIFLWFVVADWKKMFIFAT